jgi:chitinase
MTWVNINIKVGFVYQFTYTCFYYVCLDIDWEFPQNDKEAADYALLSSELRAALDQYGQQVQQTDSPKLMLTVAVPCGPENYGKLHLKDMEKYVDVFYLMAYDYSGDWDQQTGHQANLFGGSLNTDQAVNDYMAAGVPASKPSTWYSHVWT